MKKHIWVFIIPVIIVLSSSCDPLMVYDQYQKTESGNWIHKDKKTFEVFMEDSLQSYNVLVNIRHTTEYPVSNLYVFVNIQGPEGLSARDTLEIFITDSRGKWEGYGFGKIKHISRMYRRNIRFAQPGTYTFTIEQGMRQPEIPVTDVGLRIEKFRDLR